MAKTSFVIMVQSDRAPAVLGPMSEETRERVLGDLRKQYGPTCGLHVLDIDADGPERVSAAVKPYTPEGKQA